MEVKIEDTGFHKIQEVPENPFTLFKKWNHEQLTEGLSSKTLCFSTATKNGKVSARNVVLRRLDKDGFVIMTDNRSKKVAELEENPSVAMTFLWVYGNNDGTVLSRQVRAEGLINELPITDWKDIYDQEPLFCKIRAYVCHQGQKVVWDDLKEHHDKLFKEFSTGNHKLERPDHVRAYKMEPTMMEFYETLGQRIADRVLYLKENNVWEVSRIAA
ncbi:pyridoxine/pyridoxamine 5'-phosphate oxidase-like isoform X2 [Rhodnius prolixus]